MGTLYPAPSPLPPICRQTGKLSMFFLSVMCGQGGAVLVLISAMLFCYLRGLNQHAMQRDGRTHGTAAAILVETLTFVMKLGC